MGVTRAVRDERGSRYLASRLRDGSAAAGVSNHKAGTRTSPNTKRPGGGHPVRVVGGLGRFNETVCEFYRREVFPPDVVLCFNCFVGGNTSVSGVRPKRTPYPLEISELQAAKRSTPQPLSNSASCLRA